MFVVMAAFIHGSENLHFNLMSNLFISLCFCRFCLNIFFAANIFDVVVFVSCRGPHPVCVFAPGWLSAWVEDEEVVCVCLPSSPPNLLDIEVCVETCRKKVFVLSVVRLHCPETVNSSQTQCKLHRISTQSVTINFY